MTDKPIDLEREKQTRDQKKKGLMTLYRESHPKATEHEVKLQVHRFQMADREAKARDRENWWREYSRLTSAQRPGVIQRIEPPRRVPPPVQKTDEEIMKEQQQTIYDQQQLIKALRHEIQVLTKRLDQLER